MPRIISNPNRWIAPDVIWGVDEGGFGAKDKVTMAKNIKAVTTDMLNAKDGVATRGNDLYVRPENLPGYSGGGYGPPMLKLLKLGSTSEATDVLISNYTSFVMYDIEVKTYDGDKLIYSRKSSITQDKTNLRYLDTISIPPTPLPTSLTVSVRCSGWETKLPLNIPL